MKIDGTRSRKRSSPITVVAAHWEEDGFGPPDARPGSPGRRRRIAGQTVLLLPGPVYNPAVGCNQARPAVNVMTRCGSAQVENAGSLARLGHFAPLTICKR